MGGAIFFVKIHSMDISEPREVAICTRGNDIVKLNNETDFST